VRRHHIVFAPQPGSYDSNRANRAEEKVRALRRELAEAQRERDVVNLQEIDRCLAAERREWNAKYQRQQADIDRLCRELKEKEAERSRYAIDSLAFAKRAGDAEAKTASIEAGCAWKQDDFEGNWDSDCGLCWAFPDGGPAENEMRFCPGCGKKLLAVPYVPPELCGECGSELDDGRECLSCDDCGAGDMQDDLSGPEAQRRGI
jgi:hypothetical protein